MKKVKALIAALIVVSIVSVTSCQEDMVLSNTPADTTSSQNGDAP